MKWTSETPKKPGYYWAKFKGKVYMSRIHRDGLCHVSTRPGFFEWFHKNSETGKRHKWIRIEKPL